MTFYDLAKESVKILNKTLDTAQEGRPEIESHLKELNETIYEFEVDLDDYLDSSMDERRYEVDAEGSTNGKE